MNRAGDERGFTVIELLVVIGLLAIVSVGFYQVMFSGVRGGDTVQDVATISQEARMGLNRMVRDTREASHLQSDPPPTETSYNIEVVYPGTTEPESLVYSYHAGSQTIRLNGEVLMEGVEPIPGTPIFSYSSNRLQYDFDGDGIADWDELEQAQQSGVLLAEPELLVSNIDYAFQVRSGSRTTEFYAQAQLRNRR